MGGAGVSYAEKNQQEGQGSTTPAFTASLSFLRHDGGGAGGWGQRGGRRLSTAQPAVAVLLVDISGEVSSIVVVSADVAVDVTLLLFFFPDKSLSAYTLTLTCHLICIYPHHY